MPAESLPMRISLTLIPAAIVAMLVIAAAGPLTQTASAQPSGATAAWFPARAEAAETPATSQGPGASASIVNGRSASIDQFPWLAHIEYGGAAEAYECSGTVVAPRLVLTAGHCVLSEAGHLLPAANFRVISGASDLMKIGPENVSNVVQTLVAPGFDQESLRPDAALLVLQAPVSAPPIPLAGPTDTSLYAVRTPITIAGWGLTNGRSTATPTVLHQAETVIQSAGYCRQEFKHSPFGYSGSAQLCAIEAPKFEVGSCHGDSGGPGIGYRGDGTAVQVGVISFGLVAACNPRGPEAQTRVDGISEWIGQWIDAVEHGIQPPASFVPRLVRLAALTIFKAKYLDRERLAYDFGSFFTRGKYKDFSCRRIEREKAKCLVFWYHARKVYSGAITTSLSLPKEGSIVSFRYRIRRFSAVCWIYSRNPRSCPRTLFYR